MGFLRFAVVFLLGLGAALGAYATGTLDYMSRQHYFSSWYERPERGIILRVANNAQGGGFACAPRYTIDNRSGRRVLVVFASPDNASPSNTPTDSRGFYGYEGPRYASAFESDHEFGPGDSDRYESIDDGHSADAHRYRPDMAANDSDGNGLDSTRYEVDPGEKKLVGPTYGGESADAGVGRYDADDNEAMASGRCGDARVVTLQVTDCAADGACVAATNSSGAVTRNDQGDE